MAQVINSTDKLTFILTQYGLNRVAQALSNPNEDLYLFKIKVGDANFEYYTPVESQTELVHQIPNGEFYILEKTLLEDNLTVSLHSVFPESLQNTEIREIGIYETIDDVDHLFAISTQQPLLKPYVDLGYLISVDYYAFLKSQSLANVYEQIVLSPLNQSITREEFDNLMSTILFTESNLMEQSNGNTRVIGLDRVEQLQTKINEDINNFGYVTTCNNFTNLMCTIKNEDIMGYWVFNYPYRTSPNASIVDIGPNGLNFSTNLPINLYERNYVGTMPTLNFSDPNYFYLDDNAISFVENNQDISFTISYAIEPLTHGSTRTIMAQSNYSSNRHILEVNELINNSLQIKLYSDSNNYMTFTSDISTIPEKAHSVIISYDCDDKTIQAVIGGQEIPLNKVVTGEYTHMYTTSVIPLTPYIINNAGNKDQFINSNIGVISITKGTLTIDKMRAIAFNLEATMGNNPCIKKF